MTVCLLLISDGRDEYRDRTMASAKEMLPQPNWMVEIDDSDHRLGFAGAIAEGWRQVRETGAEWVFHLEGDFTFGEPIAVDRMIAVLERKPYLAQMTLKRQPVNAEEAAAGGLVERSPDAFTQKVEHGDAWTEHREYWSTNPCVYASAFCAQGWPQVDKSEGIFTHRLLEDPDLRFGMWGAKYDPPRVEHIGVERAGHGY